MSKFWASCTSFLSKMIDKKVTNPPAGGGSDTSRTQLHHKAGWVALSKNARQRLKWMEYFRKYRNARLACRHFGISPDTFYLWKKRFDPNNPSSLEDDPKTRKPHRTRPSKHLSQLKTIKQLKNIDPRLGKIRIAKILKETGYKISPSTVSRISRLLKNTA